MRPALTTIGIVEGNLRGRYHKFVYAPGDQNTSLDSADRSLQSADEEAELNCCNNSLGWVTSGDSKLIGHPD